MTHEDKKRLRAGPDCYGHCPDGPHYHASDVGGVIEILGMVPDERAEVRELLVEVVVALEPFAGGGVTGRRANVVLAKVKAQLERW